MEDVLCAAVNDIFSVTTLMIANSKVTYDKTPQDRMEHLLGLMMACVQHELHSLLDRGNPQRLKVVFADIAKEWKKFFEPGVNTSVFNISDGVREFAQSYCKAFQSMLKNTDKSHYEGATKYNFNYIRVPRPNQSKALMAKRKASNDPTTTNKSEKTDNESVARKPNM